MLKIPSKIKDRLQSFTNHKQTNNFSKPHQADKRFFLGLTPKKRLPSLKQLKHISKILTPKENKLLQALLAIIFVSGIFWAISYYIENTEKVPSLGGTYTEAMIGQPLYVNPLWSQTSDIDSDITSLIFSSLLKYNNEKKLIPDLAKGFEISENNLEYTFTLRNDVYWHDGKKFNANDVMATIGYIQDSAYESPLFLSLKGVEVEKIDNYTIKFILKKSFAPFPSILTFGIMPAHKWDGVKTGNAKLAEYNLKPTGTGPWKFKGYDKSTKGKIVSYSLTKNLNYYADKPYLTNLTFRFYDSFEDAIKALKNKKVLGIHFLPQKMKPEVKKIKNIAIKSLTFPQYTAIFFNQTTNPALKKLTVRQALRDAIPNEEIISYALDGEGTTINGPILPGFIGYAPNIKTKEFNLEQTNELLDEAGYKKYDAKEYYQDVKKDLIKNYKAEMQKKWDELQKEISQEKTPQNNPNKTIKDPETLDDETIEKNIDLTKINPSGQNFFRQKNNEILTIKLTTVNHPQNTKTAELVKNYWEKIGIKVDLIIINPQKIQNTIKKRNYEALIYGQNIGFDPDPYAFWHSSQVEYPGLNLAMFADNKADKLIIKARQSTVPKTREDNYKEFQKIINKKIPAVFLYSPTYTYTISQKIKGFNISSIVEPADRFNNLNQWYIKTDRIWKK